MKETGARILMIDDHPLAMTGIREILSRELGVAHFDSATSAAAGLELVWSNSYDIILLDLSLGGRSGLEVMEDIRRHTVSTPVLVVSMHPEEMYGVRSLKAGAAGYLRKDAPEPIVIEAVRCVLAGRRYISPGLAHDLASYVAKDDERPRHESLSRRELEVLCLIGKGRSIKEIADQLHLSVKTVSTYRARLMEKLQLDSTAALIRFCLGSNLLDDLPE